MGATTANADPVVLKQLYGDIRIRQQLYVIVQFARGDGARAFFFYLRRTRRAQAQIKVGSRQGELVSRGFEQVVGEDGNRGFSFDHSLGRRQLPQKFELADRDLHRCGSRRNRFHRHKTKSPIARHYFCYFLISKEKPIKPAVTAGASEKWKSGASCWRAPHSGQHLMLEIGAPTLSG